MKIVRKKMIFVIVIILLILAFNKMPSINFQNKNIKKIQLEKDTSYISTDLKASDNTSIPVSGQQSDVSYYFSQEDRNLDMHLIDVINSSNKTLNIAIYSITKPNIVQAIVNAKKRGVDVKLITDREEANTRSEQTQLNIIKASNIPIKINTSTRYIMHLKVTIADSNVITSGSYNYTSNGTYGNDEVLIVISNHNTATDWTNEFNKMWSSNTRFVNY